jgi:uncharacterized protein (DUF433 family)
MTSPVTTYITPKLSEGIYPVKDIAKILNLDYSKVYRWIVGYWGNGGLKEDVSYTFGEVGNRAINFFSLIEFYTFFKLREKGVSSIEIKKLHTKLGLLLNTNYPFTIAHDLWVENRNSSKKKIKKQFIYYKHLNNLIKLDKKEQYSFDFIIDEFLDKIEFNEDNIATRFFPLGFDKSVVVDPNHQFGQPTILGTNIKTQTVYNLHKGGESIKSICTLYNLSESKVEDAIFFHKLAA